MDIGEDGVTIKNGKYLRLGAGSGDSQIETADSGQDMVFKTDGATALTLTDMQAANFAGQISYGNNTAAKAGYYHGHSSWIGTPADFIQDDDNVYYNYAIMDNGGAGKVMTSSLEAYAMFRIPAGMYMTSLCVYGNDSTNNFAIYKGNVTNATVTIIDTSNSVNTPKTGLTTTTNAQEYVIVRWDAAATTDYLYGAQALFKVS